MLAGITEPVRLRLLRAVESDQILGIWHAVELLSIDHVAVRVRLVALGLKTLRALLSALTSHIVPHDDVVSVVSMSSTGSFASALRRPRAMGGMSLPSLRASRCAWSCFSVADGAAVAARSSNMHASNMWSVRSACCWPESALRWEDVPGTAVRQAVTVPTRGIAHVGGQTATK